ncbi:Acyltransferase family protein [Aminobacter sp. MSH1]|uniref:acyltransferase family protein n=1 Tax=Aminobacter sp. MSH1 TaxID=374606 RepID=UPI000D50580B|nr:acyltransferase [Aminobacter sp. MSH1]AWC20848.1 Acyltransferase family protein [Aminobacter sp. MSH1]
MRPNDRLRFTAIEGARAILCFWVFFGHALQASGFVESDLWWPLDVVGTPAQGVVGFTIVSGFVITHLITKAQEPFGLYIWRRFLRLFPLMAFCLLAVLAIQLYDPRILAFDKQYASAYIVTHATMLHGVLPNEILPASATAILGPAWSISLEWQFYLVAPVLILALFSERYAVFAAVVVFALIAAPDTWELFGRTFTFPHGAFLPTSLTFFLIGIVTYRMGEHIRALGALSLPLCVLTVILVFGVTRSYPLAIWSAVLLAMFNSAALNSFFANRTLVYLGQISYSVYLIHWIVISCLHRWAIRDHFESGTWAFFLALTVPALLITVSISALTYRFIERPFVRFGKSGTDGSKRTTAAGASA